MNPGKDQSQDILQSYLKEIDDYNTQVLTSIGTYMSLVTSDSLPSKKEMQKLIDTIANPIEQMSLLSEKSDIKEEVLNHILELKKYQLALKDEINSKSELSSEIADQVVCLYHKTSDIDNLVFELLSEE